MQHSLSSITTEGADDDGNQFARALCSQRDPILRRVGGRHDDLPKRKPGNEPSFLLFGPSCYLLLLLALRVSLITLLACALGMLLSTLRMLHALSVIALAVLLSGSAMRLCSVFVKFGSFVVIAVRHLGFLKFSSQRSTTYQTPCRSGVSRNGVAGMIDVPFGTGDFAGIKQRMGCTDLFAPISALRAVSPIECYGTSGANAPRRLTA
jgi:hypothetical protein